jgi:hypothetical protein
MCVYVNETDHQNHLWLKFDGFRSWMVTNTDFEI